MTTGSLPKDDDDMEQALLEGLLGEASGAAPHGPQEPQSALPLPSLARVSAGSDASCMLPPRRPSATGGCPLGRRLSSRSRAAIAPAHSPITQEVAIQGRISAPMAVGLVANYLLSVISLSFVGRLGVAELAAASLATTLYSVRAAVGSLRGTACLAATCTCKHC